MKKTEGVVVNYITSNVYVAAKEHRTRQIKCPLLFLNSEVDWWPDKCICRIKSVTSKHFGY